MSLPIVQLEDHTEGDTWDGIPVIGPIIINETAPGVAAARVRMTLTRVPFAAGGRAMFDTEPGDGLFPITIVDEDTWEFVVPPVPYEEFTLPAGKYEGHLEITDELGVRLTTHDLRMNILSDKTP